jgi:phosphopantetheinyl transferase
VDVEEIRPERDVRAVTEEMLDPADRDAIRGDEAFFRYWTRYEAVVKARGDGLVVPLPPLAKVAAGLDVQDLDVTTGYVAAVAADRGPWHVVRRA